jgi:hypothetical protein
MSMQRRPAGTPARVTESQMGLIVLGILCTCSVLTVGAVLLHPNSGQNAEDTAATPTAQPNWVTTWSHTTHGDETTGTFSVPSHWRFVWSCDPASDDGVPYQVLVELVRHDPGNPALDGMPYSYNEVLTTCQPGTTGGSDVIDGDAATIYAVVTTQTKSAVVNMSAQVSQ